ncbi:MAG: cation:proton antiporter [Verrucomicrobiales bacterium]|nr:cation:proton antiporter [Verrucomicrobiales bacterium]
MHGIAFLQDLAVVLIVAGLVTILFHKLKQPVVLGYILAGFIIGPQTPPYSLIHDEETIRTLSELGIILLLFSLGLEFNLRKLTQVGATAFLGALVEIIVMVTVGYGIGMAFGWGRMDSLFLGAMLAISSTTIIVKALSDLGLARERFASLIFGILIIEDILAIVMIVLLSGIAMTGSLTLADVGTTLGKLGIFLVTTLVLGLIAVPRLLNHVGRFRSNEMLLVTVLGLCFGFSLLAAKLGYSVALGAFVIGAVISEARDIVKIEHLVEPVRDMFSAVFFVTIGLMIDPKLLWEHALPIAVITVATVVGKVVSCGLGTFIAGNDTRTSLRVGMGLAQIGEFSFIIAALGLSLKVTSDFLYPIAVAVSAITTLTTPYLIRGSDATVRQLENRAPRVLLSYLRLYTQWLSQLGSRHQSGFAGKLIRRWAVQIALNLALIAAVFIGAGFVGRTPPAWMPTVAAEPRLYRTLVLLAAVVLALPMFIAAFRKFQALARLLAELKVTRARAGHRTDAIRNVVSQVITLAGLVGLILFGFALSSTLLPPLDSLLALLVIIALLVWLLWGAAIRIHSRAQVALEETLSQPPVERHAPEPTRAATFLRDTDLETVLLTHTSPALGRRLRELELRANSGASIVGIERDGQAMINPGADEILRELDQVLLLGTPRQLSEARHFLEGTTPDPSPVSPPTAT